MKSTLNLLNPQDWKRVLDLWRQNLRKKVEQLSDEEILRAVLARESYQLPEQRKLKIKNYDYLPEISNKETAVYRDPKNKHALVVYKGTNSLKDLLPDAAIATGLQGKYLPTSSFRDAEQLFQQLKEKYPGTYETIGHSLGGTKALWVGQQHQVPTHAFNPGYVSYTDDRIDVNNPLAKIYTVQGDPISNSILGTTIPNVKVLSPASYYNPFKNHTINAFIPSHYPELGTPLQSTNNSYIPLTQEGETQPRTEDIEMLEDWYRQYPTHTNVYDWWNEHLEMTPKEQKELAKLERDFL